MGGKTPAAASHYVRFAYNVHMRAYLGDFRHAAYEMEYYNTFNAPRVGAGSTATAVARDRKQSAIRVHRDKAFVSQK